SRPAISPPYIGCSRHSRASESPVAFTLAGEQPYMPCAEPTSLSTCCAKAAAPREQSMLLSSTTSAVRSAPGLASRPVSRAIRWRASASAARGPALGRRLVPPPATLSLAIHHLLKHLLIPAMRTQQPVARGYEPEVRVGFCLVADYLRLAQHGDDGLVFGLEPEVRVLAAVQPLAALLRGAESPGFHALGQLAVIPGVCELDLGARLLRERNAFVKDALVTLEREVRHRDRAVGSYARDHIGDIRVDVLPAHRLGHGYTVMPIAHEVDLADP